MSVAFPFVAQRLFNVPLAVHKPKAEIVVAALAARLGIARLIVEGRSVPLAGGPPVKAGDWYDGDDYGGIGETPYDAVAGIAVIPVRGTLVQRTGTMRPWSGMTGYDGIRQALAMAAADEAITAIVLDIDSPGGEVAGCFDLVDAIYALRGDKPIWAILGECAYSAAFAIASAADWVTVPRTGGTGSVGVICLHADFSGALEEAGVAVTLITYGDRKADGNAYQPLSAPALERFQADIDAMGELFVATVARNRGLSTAAVRETQANTFLGAAGVECGFADAVLAPDAAFQELLKQL